MSTAVDDTSGASDGRKAPRRAARSGTARHLTIAEVCKELDITRSTFYDWRAKGKAPRCLKLPNGEIRIRRNEYEVWLASLDEDAAA